MKYSLDISNFPEEISSFSPSVFFFYSCTVHRRSPACLFMLLFGTLHLAEHTFSFLPCFSLLSLVICKASASSFAFLLYFYFGMVLFAASCTIQTSVHSSGTLFTRFNPLNLFITSTAYLHVMSSGLLSSCGGGLLSRVKAVSSLVGVCLSPWGRSSVLLVLWVPHFYSWDLCTLVVRACTRLPTGSSFPLKAKGLLSRCDILGDTSQDAPGKSASVLAWEPLCHLVRWPAFLCQPSDPVKLQQGTRGASWVAVYDLGFL